MFAELIAKIAKMKSQHASEKHDRKDDDDDDEELSE